MKYEAGLRARLRYEFDKSMSAGPVALILWLGFISVAIISIASAFLAVTRIAPAGEDPLTFMESFWISLMRALDAGTMGGDTGWAFRLVMLLVTLAGIFIVSALIGVLSSGLDAKFEDLRKGRSKVLERDHTIIFNWSPSIFDVISELIIANESRRRAQIVVMADRDKVEMEDEISSKIPDLKNTRVICRSGDPTDLYDIRIASPESSRSIIVLSPEDCDPDSQVIKTVLALVNGPDRRPEPYRIAAEIREVSNVEVARVVGGDELQLVMADELIARVIVQSTRHSGLSAVFSELLDFDGCEIYVAPQPELIGMRFDDAVMAYDNCVLIGLCAADGTVKLNPPGNTKIVVGMRAILIAEDDDAIATTAPPANLQKLVAEPAILPPLERERTLLIGWNRRAPLIAAELSRYSPAGSILTIAANIPGIEEKVGALKLASDRLSVELINTDASHRDSMVALDPCAYNHVLVLGCSDDLPSQSADTKTLVTLLHLRAEGEQKGRTPSVVSEMIDVRNRELASVTRVEDFVVSNKLVSLMLAQASENPFLEAVFADLLEEDGAEISLRPVELYVPAHREVVFYEVAAAAALRGEIAIGHNRLRGQDTSGRNMGGVHINPTKSTRVTYQPEDRIVVLTRE